MMDVYMVVDMYAAKLLHSTALSKVNGFNLEV